MRRNLPITTSTAISSSSSVAPKRQSNHQTQNNFNRKKQRYQNFQHPTNTFIDQENLTEECNNNSQSCCCNNSSKIEALEIFPSSSSGFNLFEMEDRRKENAFKTVMIVCLCISGLV